MKLADEWMTQLEGDYQFRRAGLFRVLEPAQMPPLMVDGRLLNSDGMGSLLVALKYNTNVVTNDLKRYVSAEQLKVFAHALLGFWLANDANQIDRWLLFSAARLGGESVVPKIIAHYRQIRTQKVPLQPRLTLEALVMNGTQPALLYVYEFCLTVSKTRLHNLARKMLEAHAEAQNLTFFQLADRIAPDCEVNGQIFDYGRRQFTGIINNDMMLMIRDEHGKTRADLPDPGKRDDADCAAQAQENWRDARSVITSVKTTQSNLLERAMIEERRWSADEFDRFFRCHPLMRYFAQTLIWGAYKQNRLAGCFYVTPDLTLSNVHYQAFQMPPDAQIGIVHPILMNEGELRAWNHILHDFEIIQHFPQLNRDFYLPTNTEQEIGEITRFNGKSLFPSQFFSRKKGLERMDWKSQHELESPIIERHFPQADIWARIETKKTYHIKSCRFETAISQKLPLNKVSPVVISETIRDLKKALYL